jgi:hypothetical protein
MVGRACPTRGRQVELLWFDMVDAACLTHGRRVELLWFVSVDVECLTRGRRVEESSIGRVGFCLPAMISPAGRCAYFRL